MAGKQTGSLSLSREVNMKKIETSKKILLVSYIAAVTLSVSVILGSFLGLDTADLTTLASLAWGEIAVSNTFYYKKAAKENVPKIIAALDKGLQNQIDINQLLGS